MMRWITALPVALLMGCTEMMEIPATSQLDWNPDQLSIHGCPDLSGRYLAPKPAATSYRWAFPSGSERELHTSREIFLRDKDLEVFVTIHSRDDGVLTEASNGRNRVESFARYDGHMIGCFDGTLVSRYVNSLRRPGESGGGTCLSYGENRASLNSQGNLVIVFAQRRRCGTWGTLDSHQSIKEIVAAPSIFQRVQ
jgi:hypothetical protein